MSENPSDPPPVRLDYTNSHNPAPPENTSVRRVLVTLLWVGTILFLLMVLLLPSMGRAREPAHRIKCGSNLRQIGAACLIYASEHHGQFPDSVGTLLANSDLTAEVFICSSTDATRAVGPTPQAVASLLQNSPPPGSPGHCLSYVYVGGGLTNASPPSAVVAYDLPTNHPRRNGVDRGGNVLYADAHVEWHNAAGLNAIIAAVQARRNPPSAATQPANPSRP